MTTPEKPPQAYARAGGLLYLVLIVVGALGVYLRGSLVVAGDAVATAHNIAASPSLWRLGIACDLAMHVCDVFVMWCLYTILRPVNRNVALLVLLFTLIQTAVSVASKANLLVPLFLLGGAAYLQTTDPAQLQALSYVAIRVHGYGFGFALIFFGFTCLVEGYLIRKSRYLPAILGLLMQIAGACYLTNSFALLLAPAVQGRMFPAILIPCLIAEISLALWLAIKGLDPEAWNRRIEAIASGGSPAVARGSPGGSATRVDRGE
jgi:Domain of unknown function (DUF4386)